MSLYDQPEQWARIKMWCCRCDYAHIISREALQELDRTSTVFLCLDCQKLEATVG